MDSAPSAMEDVGYTWTAFWIAAIYSFSSAEVLAQKHAGMVTGIGLGQGVPVLRMYNIVLSIYTIVVFYVTMILWCILVYCLLAAIHLWFESYFRLDMRSLKDPSVRKMVHVVDNLTDPGLVFAFLSKRLWKLHGAVFLAAIAASVFHSIVFISKARFRSMGVDLQKPLPAGLSKDLFFESNNTVISVMIALYTILIIREFSLLYSANDE